MPVNKTGKSGAEEQAITTIDPADAAALAGGQTLYDDRSPELNALLENQPQPFTFEMAPASSVPTSDPIQPRAALFADYTSESVLKILNKGEWSEGVSAMMAPVIEASEAVSLDFLRENRLYLLTGLSPKSNKWISLAHSITRLENEHRKATDSGDDDTPPTYVFNNINDPQFQADMTALIDNLGQALDCVTKCLRNMLWTDEGVTKKYLSTVNWTQPDNTKWLVNFYLENPRVQVTKELLSQLITNKNPLAIQLLQASLDINKLDELKNLLSFLPALISETKGEASNTLKIIVEHIVTKSYTDRDGRSEYDAELHAILMILLHHDLTNFIELLNTPGIASKTIQALRTLPPADQPAAAKILLKNLPAPIVGSLSKNGSLFILGNIAEQDSDLFELIVSMADGSKSTSPEVKALGLKLLERMVQKLNSKAKFQPAENVLVRLALEFQGNLVNNPYVSAVDLRPEIIKLWLTYAQGDFTSNKYPRHTLLSSDNVPDTDKLAILRAHPDMINNTPMRTIIFLLERTKNAELRSQLVAYCQKNGFNTDREILTSFFADTFDPNEAPIRDLFFRVLKENATDNADLILATLEQYKDHPAIQTAWSLYQLKRSPEGQSIEAATQLIDPADTPSPVLLGGLLEFFANRGFWNMPADLIGALQTVPVAKRLVRESVRNLMDIAVEAHPDQAIRAQIFKIKTKQTELNIAASVSAGGGKSAEITAINGFDELDGFGGVPAGYGFVGNGFFAPRALGGVVRL